jgi:hypothetical protein
MVGKYRAPWRAFGIGLRIVRRRHCVIGFRAGDIAVEILEPERKLIGIEALGAATERTSLKLLDEALEPFDLVVAGLDNDRHIAHQAVQKVDIRRQVSEVETHERF